MTSSPATHRFVEDLLDPKEQLLPCHEVEKVMNYPGFRARDKTGSMSHGWVRAAAVRKWDVGRKQRPLQHI
jgi:hypothetical protein